MFLAIDIGNTNVTCGIHDGNTWIKIIRISSNMNFENQFNILKKYKVNNAAISSVVPQLTDLYHKSITHMFQINALIIDYKNSNINLDVITPKEVGVDRICNCAAAIEIGKLPVIIGDIGSATNYDVVNQKRAFIGGAIAPGLEVAARNLLSKAALLKDTTFIVPDNAIGKDTNSNLQSGIMLGAIDVIDGMFKRIQIEAGWNDVNNIITGGFGKLISPHLKTKHLFIPTLTLDGIKLIHDRQ